MNQAEIYYFSGTGNSLAIARGIAGELGAQLIPITAALQQERIESNAEVIGVVFPIYDFKPPALVEDFIRKLRNIDAKYLFAVCTYGIAPAQSLEHLNRVIASCGGHLAGGFAIGMPHNGIGSSAVTQAQQEEQLRDSQRQIADICTYVNDRAEGQIASSSLWRGFLQPRVLRMMPALLSFSARLISKGIGSLALTASPACNGCEICAKICPVNNIAMVDDKPQWGDHCAGCFACIHWCPQEAISLGGANMYIGHYHHPDVKLADMLKARAQFVRQE